MFLAFKNFDLRLAKKLRLGKHYLTEAFKSILFFVLCTHILDRPPRTKMGLSVDVPEFLYMYCFLLPLVFHQLDDTKKIFKKYDQLLNDKNYWRKLLKFDN